MVVVVDYGMGNLRSVAKALQAVGASVRVTSDPRDVTQARKLILPGVGAFGAAMRELSARKLIEPLKAAIASGTPYLGICLGLQLLFDSSEESPGVPGFGILPGAVKRFSFSGPRSPLTSHLSPLTCHLKVPHMGWNQVIRPQQSAISNQQSAEAKKRKRETIPFDQEPCPLLRDVPEGSFFYFVHSYYGEPADRSVVALEAEHGVRFAAMVWRGHLFATQFHPEKSQTLGLKVLGNFLDLS